MSDSAPAVSVYAVAVPHAAATNAPELHAPAPLERRKEIRNGLLCALAAAAAVLATVPLAETGFQDDWSYIRTAYEFERTGHFVYNGWTTAMLGWIIPWSALFIKLFGFSFTLTRATLLPVTMACVYLFHASLVRFGIRGSSAVLGALTLGLSPVFIPLAASYMTDVPGLFVIVLCLYLCQRAAAAHTSRETILWLCLAAFTNVIGGTVRQIAWLGVLVMVPSTAWYLRRRRGVLLTAGLLWIAAFTSIRALLYWWNRQPYSVPEHIIQGQTTYLKTHHLIGSITKGFLCLLLLLFPILAAGFSSRRLATRAAVLRVIAGVLLTGIVLTILQHFIPDAWLMPWLTHMIQSEMRGSGEFPGVLEISWPAWARILLSTLVIGATLSWIEQAISTRRQSARKADPTPACTREIFWILVPFSLSYLALLLPRGLYGMIYDRYFMGFMPLAIVLLLRWYERKNGLGAPPISLAALTVFALFAILTTHDWFAVNRARLAAVHEVESAGVPRTRIQGAFELDGWAQIDAGRYVNEKRIEFPAGAYRENMRMYRMPEHCWHFFGWYSPDIDPLYTVAATPDPCYDDSAFAPVHFRIWMPPFHRTIYIRRFKGSPQ